MISRWSVCKSRTISTRSALSGGSDAPSVTPPHRGQPHEARGEDQGRHRPVEAVERYPLADRAGEADPDVPATDQMQQAPFARAEPGRGAVERGRGHGGDEEVGPARQHDGAEVRQLPEQWLVD